MKLIGIHSLLNLKNGQNRLQKKLFIHQEPQKTDLKNELSLFHFLQNKDEIFDFRFKSSGQLLMKMESQQQINGPGEEIIFKKGWARFVIFDPSKMDQQTSFYRNDAYFEQQKRPNATNESDAYGPINIPSERSFFFVLTKDSLYAISARRNDLSKTQEVLSLASLLPQAEGQFQGGVEDQGNFREGYCFKLNVMRRGSKKIWVMCVDDPHQKTLWMNSIARNKLAQQSTYYSSSSQQLEGEAVIGNTNIDQEAIQYGELGPDGKPVVKGADAANQKRDGQWIILQQWSTCSLACGGGTQTLHRFCIPPANGGAPCVGLAIQTKACNTAPCPDVKQISVKEEQVPTRVKMMKLSKRPSRYETCIIKEGDLDLVRDDLIQFKRKPRVPCRVVLNNMTFTVFQSDHYDTVYFSAPLETISIVPSSSDKKVCFQVIDGGSKRNVNLCTMQTVTTDLRKEKDEWVKQIYFFRDKCHQPLKLLPIDDPISKIKKRELEEEEMDFKSQDNSGLKIDALNKGLESMSQLALDAMTKEMKYEQSAEWEEIMRERQEDLNLQKKMEEMKEKQECLQRDFNKKNRNIENSMQSRDLEEQINELKDNIKQMILKARTKQSKKIQVMKKLADKKRRAKLDQIQTLRLKMAQDLIGAHKKGNITQCVGEKITQNDINSYCDCNFATDFTSNKECKDREWFCWMCCENEFGEYLGAERDKCFASCDKKKKGNWVWVPEENQVTPSLS